MATAFAAEDQVVPRLHCVHEMSDVVVQAAVT